LGLLKCVETLDSVSNYYFLQVYMRNRYLVLANQITVFITTRI
jgi:hypothetical protein